MELKDFFINPCCKTWQDGIKQKDAIIDKQAAELAALRGFAETVVPIINYNNGFLHWFEVRQVAQSYKLIDENGNPTKLLTGE